MTYCRTCGESYPDGTAHMCPVEPPAHRDDGDAMKGIMWGIAIGALAWVIILAGIYFAAVQR